MRGVSKACTPLKCGVCRNEFSEKKSGNRVQETTEQLRGGIVTRVAELFELFAQR